MEEITVYKTNDSKIHNTKEDAKKHISNLLCERLDKRLSRIHENDKGTVFQRHHIMDIVDFLMGDYEEAKRLINDLFIILE